MSKYIVYALVTAAVVAAIVRNTGSEPLEVLAVIALVVWMFRYAAKHK